MILIFVYIWIGIAIFGLGFAFLALLSSKVLDYLIENFDGNTGTFCWALFVVIVLIPGISFLMFGSISLTIFMIG